MSASDRESSPTLILAGPTAVGKSSLALEWADRLGAEVLSADSRQVYRGLDVGTAKPTAEEQARVPHHLIDVRDPGEPYSAGQFLRDARAVLSEVHARGRPAVVVGGSTLYVHALIDGLADLPPLSAGLTSALTERATTAAGRRQLYAELEAADPTAAQTLDPTKSQRLVRLVGLLREHGRPPSEMWAEAHVPGVDHRLVLLQRPRAELYERIDRRVDAMMSAGLRDEVRRLWSDQPASHGLLHATIGYHEMVEHLEGRLALEDAVSLIQRRSRRYAKRQITWYRRYETAVRLDAGTARVDDLVSGV